MRRLEYTEYIVTGSHLEARKEDRPAAIHQRGFYTAIGALIAGCGS
jgi:hypothetical protein